MKIKNLHILLHIITSVALSLMMCLFFSCTDKHSNDITEEYPESGNNDCMSFHLDSRSIDDIDNLTSRTFRIVTYTTNYHKKDQTGTFVFQNETNKLGQLVLTPYPLLDNGERNDESSISDTESIIRKSNFYNVIVVSPGIKCNDDGSFKLNLKDLQNDDKKIYFPQDVEYLNFSSYGSINLTQTLLDYRSKIGFKFYKAEEAEDFSISNIQILGAGSMDEDVELHPQLHQVVTNPESYIDIPLIDVKNNNETDSEGNSLYYDTNERNLISIVPGIYAPRDTVSKKLNISKSYLLDTDYITMKCELKQGIRDELPIHLNITQTQPVFKPQNKYIYNIVIRSNYIIMTVDVYDNETFGANGWEFGANEGSEISDPDRINLGFWKIVQSSDKGWELVELDEQTIE